MKTIECVGTSGRSILGRIFNLFRRRDRVMEIVSERARLDILFEPDSDDTWDKYQSNLLDQLVKEINADVRTDHGNHIHQVYIQHTPVDLNGNVTFGVRVKYCSGKTREFRLTINNMGCGSCPPDQGIREVKDGNGPAWIMG